MCGEACLAAHPAGKAASQGLLRQTSEGELPGAGLLLRHIYQVFQDESVRVRRDTDVAVKWLVVDYNHEEDHGEEAAHQAYEYGVQLQIRNVEKVCDADTNRCTDPYDRPHYDREAATDCVYP